ncbi:MAG: hypothetical protein ACTSQE_17190, partial [Candidatus Heimdallarchaeaceae archaeon]
SATYLGILDINDYVNWTDGNATYMDRNDWTSIDDYPANCNAGEYVYGIGDSLICSVLPSGMDYTNVAMLNESNTFIEPQIFENITIETKIDSSLNSTTCFKFKENGDIGVSLVC